MKKSEFKKLIKEVIQEETQIKEVRQVWKSSEYEEIADYVSNLQDLLPYLKKEGMDVLEYTDIMGALTRLAELNDRFGTEEID